MVALLQVVYFKHLCSLNMEFKNQIINRKLHVPSKVASISGTV